MDPKNPPSARLEWHDNFPVSTRFDDPYFSDADGLLEARHVFLDGNNLPMRFRAGFHIAELGFGTGLNLLAAWQAWRDSGIQGQLFFTSFEAYPMATPDMARALSCWPELAPLADILMAHGGQSFCTTDLRFELIIGDASQCLATWKGQADAWFLDGFSPQKNPDMWSENLLSDVGQHTIIGGSVATYSAAGHVRKKLQNAGFSVQRVNGFGRKRHMSVGVRERA